MHLGPVFNIWMVSLIHITLEHVTSQSHTENETNDFKQF